MNRYFYLTVLFFLVSFATGFAQAPAGDTSKKLVQWINSEIFRSEKKDSVTEVQTMVKNVHLEQGSTRFYCDSAIYNKHLKTVEAFGNVHINDADSVHTYSQYLLYHVDTRIAFLREKVKLTDNKIILTTEELRYDANEKIGDYYNGGRVVNGKTVLTSKEGTYYGELKDVYFKKNVVLNDPQYNLRSDSLLYNTTTEIATFITRTYIRQDSTKRDITTDDGYYDLKNKKAYFGKRPVIHDGRTLIIANDVQTDDATGINILRGNAVFVDSVQGVSVLANLIEANKYAGTFFATQNPLMIIQQKNDSIYVTADTLFSGRLSTLKRVTDSLNRIKDSLNRLADTTELSGKPPAVASISPAPDSLHRPTDSLHRPADSLPRPQDSLLAATTAVARVPDTPAAIKVPPPRTDSLPPVVIDTKDTLRGVTVIDSASAPVNDSTDRYFQAYHHVRIFSDSLQAVSDSLFYSGKDSVFRLFTDPVVWSGDNQITGDTIYMYTKNKQPDRLYVFENALAINKLANVGRDLYNQLKGNRITAVFVDGVIDYMRAKGNAESVYYVLDEDSALVGINKVAGDIIDLRFKNKELDKVVVISEPNGTMLPVSQATEQDRFLRNFKWQEARRPKSKYELFGN